jgi:hypothetical protein
MRSETATMATCPICKSDAEEVNAGFFYGKTFRCPKHGEFDVAISVLTDPALLNASMNEWESALAIALGKAIKGARPRILQYDFHDRLKNLE